MPTQSQRDRIAAQRARAKINKARRAQTDLSVRDFQQSDQFVGRDTPVFRNQNVQQPTAGSQLRQRNITPALAAAQQAQASRPLHFGSTGKTIAAGAPGTIQDEKRLERDLLAKGFKSKQARVDELTQRAREAAGLYGGKENVVERFGGGPTKTERSFNFETSSDPELNRMRKHLADIKNQRGVFGGSRKELIKRLEGQVAAREQQVFEQSDAFQQLKIDLEGLESDEDIRTFAGRQARSEAKGFASNLSIMRTPQGDVEIDRDRIERLVNGTSLASDQKLDRLEKETDEQFAVRKMNAVKNMEQDRINRQYNQQKTQIKESFASFADPNTGQVNPNAARRMAKSLRKLASERDFQMSQLEKRAELNLETFIRSVRAEGGRERSPLEVLQERSEMEIASTAMQLAQNQGLPLTTAIQKAKDMLEYKTAKDETKQDKIDALNAFESGQGIDRGNAAGFVFNKLRNYADTEDYMRDVLGMDGATIKDQIIKEKLANNSYMEEGDLRLSEEQREVRVKKESILDGKGDSSAEDVASLLKYYDGIDQTGFLRDEFARQVELSPNTNFREKALAQMTIATSEVERRNKLQTKQTITKDRFGNIIAVDPFTLRVSGVGGGGGVQRASGPTFSPDGKADTPNMVIAREIEAGNLTPGEVKTLYGEQRTEAIGRDLLALRAANRASGQVLTSKKQKELNEKITKSDQFRALKVAEPTLNALIEFEKAFDKVGGEIFGEEIDSQYRTALLEMKELFNLGVLNGPDLDIMESILPPPSASAEEGFFGTLGALGGLGTGFRQKAVQNGLDVMRQKIAATVEERFNDIVDIYGEFGEENLSAIKNARNIKDRTLQKLGVPSAQGETVRVRVKSTGATGTVPRGEFDESIYEKID